MRLAAIQFNTSEAESHTLDAHSMVQKLEASEAIFMFEGTTSPELHDAVLKTIEDRLVALQEPLKLQRRVLNLMVECLHNLYHHAQPADNREYASGTRPAIFFCIGRADNAYYISTGNYVSGRTADRLGTRFEKLNAMDCDALRNEYREVLASAYRPKRGGGGLGFIEMIRRSGNRLQYSFSPTAHNHYFFTLQLNVARVPCLKMD